MPTSAAIYAPPSGHDVITLSGSIETDAQFATQPTADDQIVHPSALTVDAQLNISGSPDSYVLWHVRSAGLVIHTPYDIENLNAPVLSAQSIDQITSSGMRFNVQTNKAGGTWYVKIGTSMPSDGDTVSTGVSASVPSAGVLSHTFTGLTAATAYYIKAVHIDADTNVSNYVTASQATISSGSIVSPAVYAPPAGYVVATLEAGYDTYAIQAFPEVIADEDLTGSQFITPDDQTYFDNLGNLYFNNLTDSVFWFARPSGTVYRQQIINKDELSSVVPQDLDDQSVTGADPSSWIEMPSQVILAIDASSSAISAVDNSLAQQRWSTDAGATFDDWSSDERTGLVATDVGEFRLFSPPDYSNTGSNYQDSAVVNINGVTFTISVTNRAAVVPTITAQPASQNVSAEDPVTLSVTANTGGLADPITYQWQKSGVNILSATSNSYNIGSAALSDAGSYAVRLLSSEGGLTVSNTAVLTVDSDPPVYVESAEGLANVNTPSVLLLGEDVGYEIVVGGVVVLSGTAATDATTGKLRIESVTSVIGPADSSVELRYPMVGTYYFNGETVTVQAV